MPEKKEKKEEEHEEAGGEEAAEVADPFPGVRAGCERHHCEKYRHKLDECNQRVSSRTKTEESCHEEVVDLFHCVDHCAGPKIFAKLK